MEALLEIQSLQQMQRRIIRLLLLHNTPLFRNQFRHFFIQSALPQIPLLQQYDRYIKLQTLSNELLDDILPRIRRQLSLKTSHLSLREEAPTRGEIDWPRTIELNGRSAPGLPPLLFETRLRQRSMETPENLLTVAILLAYRQELQQALNEGFADEILSQQERLVFMRADEKAQRELAAPYARSLMKQAQRVQPHELASQVALHLRPGPGPYRDLLAWWQRLTQFRVGRVQEGSVATDKRTPTLTSKRSDEKTAAWLYELWIALEFIHLLDEEGMLQPRDMHVATDLLQCTFSWQGRRLRFIYNRQLDTMTGYISDWEHGPASRPDYTIEREQPLEIHHNGSLLWREPAVLLDAKYYLEGKDPTNTHGPIKKLLGDMTLLGSQIGVLCFPNLPEPDDGQQVTRIIRRSGQQYQTEDRQVYLYHLLPTMPFPALQTRLRAMLDLALQHLPERPDPVCRGVWLDTDHTGSPFPPGTVLCPKPHIGPQVHDLVNINNDCLKNPRLCHIIGKASVPPFQR